MTEPPSDGQQGSTRDILIKTASDLMIERLSVDISLAEIAQRSGLNSALVKYYFGSKSGMMVALLEEVLRAPQLQMIELFESDVSPIEKLKLHIKGMIRTYFHYPYVSRLIHAVSQNPDTAQRVSRTVTTPLVQAQEKLLSEGVAKGAFREIDVTFFYFIVIGACDHLFFEQHILRYAFGVERVSAALRVSLENTLVDVILRGLVKDPALLDRAP